jgi:hypothetical protein
MYNLLIKRIFSILLLIKVCTIAGLSQDNISLNLYELLIGA